MALTGVTDDLVKEYLLYRGLNSTVRTLDSEIKNDKDKGYRVDKILEQFHSTISNYDLGGLREYWAFLDRRLFSRLEQVYASSVHKLEVSLLKLYVINAVQSGRHDKVTEFFEKLSVREQSSSEWKEWFVLPFIKNAEDHNIFAMYFTKQWQDTLFLSLHNFLSIVISAMPTPVLLNHEESQRQIEILKDENTRLKQQLIKVVEERDTNISLESLNLNADPLTPGPGGPGPSSMDLMDDFFVISQDTVIEDKPAAAVGKTQQLRSFIRNIGLPSSPIMGKKTLQPSQGASGSQGAGGKNSGSPQQQGTTGKKESESTVSSNTVSQTKQRSSEMAPILGTTRQSRTKQSGMSANPSSQSGSSATSEPDAIDGQKMEKEGKGREKGDGPQMQTSAGPEQTASVPTPEHNPVPDGSQSAYLLLSQDEYSEHHSSLTHCRFSSMGQAVATSDVDGVVKVWNLQPSPVTMATTMSKSMLLSLEWANKTDRLLLLGSKSGTVRLFDVKEKKTVKEVTTESAYPRIVSLASSPCGGYFVCSGAGRLRASTSSPEQAGPRVGKLTIWDIKAMKIDRPLSLSPGPIAINSTAYNHNGQLLITGGADGLIRLFDMRKNESITSWAAHNGEVYSVLFSPDETSCFSMGTDGKWSIHNTGQRMRELPVHSGACGPFVLTGQGGYRQVQTPKGRLFAFDTDGRYVLTCAPGGGLIYKLGGDVGLEPALQLGGHRTPVVCVDWSTATDCKMCVTGCMDGRVKVSTLLPQ